MAANDKKTDAPVDPKVEIETPPEAPVEKTATTVRKSPPNWLWMILTGVIVVVLLGLNYNSCSSNKDLAKQVVKTQAGFDSLNAKVGALTKTVDDAKNQISEMDDKYQDSLNWANNPEWLRVADSLAYEYSQKKEGGKK